MTKRLLSLVSLLVLGALAGGCCNRCHRPGASCPPRAMPAPLPPPPTVAGPIVPGPVPVPAPPPPNPAPGWPSTPPAVRNYTPEEPVPDVRLSPPEAAQPPAKVTPPAVQEGPSPEPPLVPREDDKKPSPPLPVGISGFAYPYPEAKIATGQKPLLDGLEWLKDNGYRTVLHIKAPGEEDAADRKLVEKLGMKYLSLELSPQTLNKQAVEDFARIVGDRTGQPLFVYDKDGALAGSLWYLQFRTTDRLGDEDARTRAGRLGLKADAPEQRTLWLAIQKFLSQQS